jgi:hypothetical protein
MKPVFCAARIEILLMSENDIPEYVQNALKDWNALALLAYDWHVRFGRIVVAIEKSTNPHNIKGFELLAVQYDLQSDKIEETVAQLLAGYDPETEILIQFQDNLGHVRTQRLRTASGAQHPKKLYFFEMLRRITEEPESVDINTLPTWFQEMLKKLESVKKPTETETAGNKRPVT